MTNHHTHRKIMFCTEKVQTTFLDGNHLFLNLNVSIYLVYQNYGKLQ